MECDCLSSGRAGSWIGDLWVLIRRGLSGQGENLGGGLMTRFDFARIEARRVRFLFSFRDSTSLVKVGACFISAARDRMNLD